MAARSKGWVCGLSPAEIVVSNPAGGTDVCLLWVFCVMSGGGLCDELITRPEESYRLWCVVVWPRNLENEEAMAAVTQEEKKVPEILCISYLNEKAVTVKTGWQVE